MVEKWSGTAAGMHGDIEVEVALADDCLLSIEVLNQQETANLADKVYETIPQRIIDQQSLNVDTVSGATVSSKAIINATAAALKAAGLDPENYQKITSVQTEKVTTEVIDADVLVVGGGAAGLAAALAAEEAGAKVAILEKQAQFGGSANFAEGIFAAESRLQKNDYIDITKDQAFNFIMEYSHWRANPRIARAFVEKSADTINWLLGHGITFEKVTTNNPGGLRTWHIFDGHGAGYIQKMSALIKDRDIACYFDTAGKELIMEGDQVVGLKAEQDQKNLVFRCSSVIIASGGYANNAEMMAKYTGQTNIYPVGNSNKTGEGIQMAWEVGAGEEGTGVLQLYRPGVPGQSSTSLLNAAARQPHLWINQRGDRFCNEEIVSLWPFAGNALANQPDGVMYSVFDQATKEKLVEEGIKIGVGVLVPTGTKLVGIDDELSQGQANGDVFIADSIEDLAEQLQFSQAELRQTIADYNKISESRQDNLFAKKPKYAAPIEAGPFYAIRCANHFLGTLGGIKINEKAEVVTSENRPIAGLYAAGNDAGGMYGDSYDLNLPGGTFGFAVNFGRIAGENAAKGF
ncbi:FAD-dependent oxidoreductase [Aerococcus mictus]